MLFGCNLTVQCHSGLCAHLYSLTICQFMRRDIVNMKYIWH